MNELSKRLFNIMKHKLTKENFFHNHFAPEWQEVKKSGKVGILLFHTYLSCIYLSLTYTCTCLLQLNQFFEDSIKDLSCPEHDMSVLKPSMFTKLKNFFHNTRKEANRFIKGLNIDGVDEMKQLDMMYGVFILFIEMGNRLEETSPCTLLQFPLGRV